jgi:hypothetical protein
MKTQFFSLALSIVLSGCVRSPRSPEVPIENDLSVRFPQFFEHEAIAVGAGQVPYELDGEVLRAIMIATNDLLSPSIADQPCRSRLEAQFYRVIREQNIIFVYIYENHAYCGRQYPAPDSGAKYAISTDGRKYPGTGNDRVDSTPAPALYIQLCMSSNSYLASYPPANPYGWLVRSAALGAET